MGLGKGWGDRSPFVFVVVMTDKIRQEALGIRNVHVTLVLRREQVDEIVWKCEC